MRDLATPGERAVMHMREAMTLLEEASEGIAAAHLQAAIDSVERVAPLRPGDELPDAGPAIRSSRRRSLPQKW